MSFFKTFLTPTLAAISICAVGVTAQAATLSGTFDVRVVNYILDTGTSSERRLGSYATQDNFDARFDAASDGVNRDSFTYTGELDFFIDNAPSDVDAESIADFFLGNSDGTPVGLVSGLDSTVGGLQLSAPTFRTTTLFEFTEVYSNAFDTRVTHDDGFTIYDNDNALITYANPTGIRTTPVTGTSNFSGGEFRLVYAAANGNPSRLLVEGDGISAVPLPAPALMLLAGIGAFAGLRRRKSRS